MDSLQQRNLLFRGMFVLWGIGLLAFSFGTMWQRAKLDLDGIIQVADQRKDTSGPHRYYTVYTIAPAVAGDSFQYVAQGNDAALPRNLAVGTHIQKQRWHLSYAVNGQLADDFPRIFYGCTAAIGFIIFLAASIVCYKKWKTYAA